MAEAVGIHDHPDWKLGLAPTDPAKPILAIDEVLTEAALPTSEDRYQGVTFGLDLNDRFGICGPTSVDNHRRSTSKVATGAQRTAPQEAVNLLYRESGNPNFNPADPGTEDNGVEMGAMMDALLANGLAGDKPVAFGRSKKTDDATLERLVATFGGVLFAVFLEEAQQAQSEGAHPEWKFAKSGAWGGHAIYCGKYAVRGPGDVDAPVISWAKEIGTADSFRSEQLEEVWVVIWPWHLEHPAFLAGVDQAKLAAAFKELTGATLPLPPAPAPTPAPTPTPTPTPAADDADRTLEAATRAWRSEHHRGENRKAAVALEAWAQAKGIG